MPYFHATHERHMESILAHGLGGVVVERNFPECVPGVYLGSDPVIVLGFMFEHMMLTADDQDDPRSAMASWRVIVVDDSRLNSAKLKADPQIDLEEFRLYHGIIDVTGLPVLTVDQLSPG